MVTEESIRATLTELRSLWRCVRRGAFALADDDMPLLGALLSKEISRAERRQAKMLAKAGG